jgi:hypothetical protein
MYHVPLETAVEDVSSPISDSSTDSWSRARTKNPFKVPDDEERSTILSEEHEMKLNRHKLIKRGSITPVIGPYDSIKMRPHSVIRSPPIPDELPHVQTQNSRKVHPLVRDVILQKTGDLSLSDCDRYEER